MAKPDQSLEARVGDLVILPGECAAAPEADARGRLTISVKDSDLRVNTHRVRVPRARRTTLWVEAGGKKVVQVTHPACSTGELWPEPGALHSD